MNSFLKLKHWKVFLVSVLVMFLSNSTWEQNAQLTFFVRTVGSLLYFSMYFIFGVSLVKNLPPRVELMDTVFTLNGFLILISNLGVYVFFNGSFSGHGILGFVWVLYLFYATFQFFSFPAKALKTIEIGREAAFGEYFGYFMAFLFFPVGVWFLQPKINRIVEGNSSS